MSTVVAQATPGSNAGTHEISVRIRGAQITATVGTLGALTYTIPDVAAKADWTKVGFRDASITTAVNNLSVTAP
ncbi:hypothetical protein ACX5K5_06100 [Glutamicibacter bergerei]